MSTLPWNWIIPIAIVALAILVSVGVHMMQQARRTGDTQPQARPHPDAADKPRAGAQAEAD